jgi:hypothetical protein
LYPLDKDLYAQRHRIECCFLKLKQVRWLATGFEKTAKNDRAAATSASFFVTKLLTERLSQSVCAISCSTIPCILAECPRWPSIAG